MNIGEAREAWKSGFKVTRNGWNGKSMFLFWVPGDTEMGATEFFDVTGKKIGEYEMQGYVAMKTAQNTVVPWLCSQSDLDAEDWEIYTGT